MHLKYIVEKHLKFVSCGWKKNYIPTYNYKCQAKFLKKYLMNPIKKISHSLFFGYFPKMYLGFKIRLGIKQRRAIQILGLGRK